MIRLIRLKDLILIKHFHCYYWCFLKISFRFKPKLCNGYQDLMQQVINFNLMMLQMLIHFQYMNQNETKNILSNANLNEKSGSL